jgi:hypothetical protein
LYRQPATTGQIDEQEEKEATRSEQDFCENLPVKIFFSQIYSHKKVKIK